MRSITEYLNINVKPNIIHATDDTIKQIVKDELDRLGHDADLNHINVSEVTDMYNVFRCDGYGIFNNKPGDTFYKDLNPNISNWDVSNVKNMSWVFYCCENFNCNISCWDVSNVENMNGMFFECENFNQDLSQWDVSNVKGMESMFKECKKFNQDLSGWDVINVKDYNYMFYKCPIKEEYKPHFIK